MYVRKTRKQLNINTLGEHDEETLHNELVY